MALTTSMAIASMDRRAKATANRVEADRIIRDFCSSPTMFNAARHTCSRAVGKLLIAHGLTFAAGYGYYATTKHLGCGVYHITFEKS